MERETVGGWHIQLHRDGPLRAVIRREREKEVVILSWAGTSNTKKVSDDNHAAGLAELGQPTVGCIDLKAALREEVQCSFLKEV